FVAILALLSCAIVVRADKPTMIKDSEAIKYVGKEVEVRGRVVSVTASPLGTTFINFGGAYPNQTFAGFIAAGSPITSDQRLTMIQGKTISITGTIRLREGKPEIEIVSADQIKGLDSQAEGESSAVSSCPPRFRTRNKRGLTWFSGLKEFFDRSQFFCTWP